jgi:hypothetical protein
MSAEVALEARGLDVLYADYQILWDVSFVVPAARWWPSSDRTARASPRS